MDVKILFAKCDNFGTLLQVTYVLAGKYLRLHPRTVRQCCTLGSHPCTPQ